MIIPNDGVTSLLTYQQQGANHVDIFVGTKRGKIQHVQYADHNMESLGEIHNEKIDQSRFPYFRWQAQR